MFFSFIGSSIFQNLLFKELLFLYMARVQLVFFFKGPEGARVFLSAVKLEHLLLLSRTSCQMVSILFSALFLLAFSLSVKILSGLSLILSHLHLSGQPALHGPPREP